MEDLDRLWNVGVTLFHGSFQFSFAFLEAAQKDADVIALRVILPQEQSSNCKYTISYLVLFLQTLNYYRIDFLGFLRLRAALSRGLFLLPAPCIGKCPGKVAQSQRNLCQWGQMGGNCLMSPKMQEPVDNRGPFFCCLLTRSRCLQEIIQCIDGSYGPPWKLC